LPLWNFLFHETCPKGHEKEVSILGFHAKFWTIERGKKKKSFGRENGETKRRGQRSSSSILKKARILVQLQL
jgi:hypothetical protein